jgi:hypothetical protein
MSKNFRFTSLLFALMLCFTATAFGQETTGNIEVTVRDQAGAVVPNIAVTVASATSTTNPGTGRNNSVSTGFRRTLNTNSEGFQRFLEVPPGLYTVTTESTSGFGGATINNVQVTLGKTTPVNVELGAAGSTVTVDVNSDDVVAIDPTDSKLQTNITAQVAELLPKGTNFSSLLKIAPAVREEPLSGGFQIDGASGSENTFIIDGQEVTNYRTGTLNDNNDLPFQIIQEIQVKSSGFEAEFGGATGGVINLVTKGGGNDFRGEFGIQFRPQKLRASPRPSLIVDPRDPFASEYLQFNRDGGLATFPTASLSGPIIKDRVWFFASYTPQVFNISRTINYVDPISRALGATERYSAKQVNQYAFGRIDAQPFSSLRLTGTFTYNPIIQDGLLPANTTLFDSALPSNAAGTLVGAAFQETLGGRQNANNTTFRGIWTPTSNLIISAGGGRQFLNEKLGSYGAENVLARARVICSTGVGAPPPSAGCEVGQTNGVPFLEQLLFDASTRDTFDADATYIVNFGGRHEFKGGFSFNRIKNELFNTFTDQIVLRYGRSIALTAGRSNLVSTPGAIGSGFIRRFNENGDVQGDNQGIFFQDKWQPFRRLTLNLGIRTERETIPSFNSQAEDLTFDFSDKLAPRIGGAFDLTGDGKTKLSAFYGWFYDRFKYELPRGSFGGQFFRDDYFEIFPDSPAAFNLTREFLIGSSPTDPIGGACPNNAILFGRIRCQIDRRIPSNAGLGLEFGAIDPDIQAFRQSEFTVNVERDLGRNFVLAGRYTFKNVDRAIEDAGFLTSTGGEAYIIGNPGRGLTREVSEANGFLSVEPKRRYDAFEVRLDRRFANNYYFNVNYTYSRLRGNYSGLASSDEDGRTSPNVNRFFDLPIAGFTAAGTIDNGPLPTDRPHALKFAGAYSLNWNERFGFGGTNITEFQVFSTLQSGTPITTVIDILGIDTIPLTRRGDLGRTERFTETDFAIRHRYRFGRDNRFTLVGELDVLNLFNENNELGQFSLISTNSFGLTEPQLGLVTDQERATLPVLQQEALGIARLQRRDASSLFRSYIENPELGGGIDPRYQQTNFFQAPRQIRFGFRLLF